MQRCCVNDACRDAFDKGYLGMPEYEPCGLTKDTPRVGEIVASTCHFFNGISVRAQICLQT
jgi:hypothetical protein